MRIRRITLDQASGRLLAQPEAWEEESPAPKAPPALIRLAIRQELTPRQRQCVELYFFQRMTMEEVGRELGIGKATVCRHLQKSKKRLGRALSYAAPKPGPSP